MNVRRKVLKLPGAFGTVMFPVLSFQGSAQTSVLASWNDGPAKQATVSFIKGSYTHMNWLPSIPGVKDFTLSSKATLL